MKIQNQNEEVKNTGAEPEDVAKAKKIAQLKKKYKRLYVTKIAGEDIYWRPLKRSEFKNLLNMEFPEGTSEEDIIYDRETFIAECAVVYPEDAVEEIALVAEIISTQCMAKSGFVERNSSDYDEV